MCRSTQAQASEQRPGEDARQAGTSLPQAEATCDRARGVPFWGSVPLVTRSAFKPLVLIGIILCVNYRFKQRKDFV